MAQTLNDIILNVGRNFGNVLAGALTSGGTTTVTDTNNLIQPDNYWENYYCRFDAADQERLVTAYSQSTKTLTVDPAFSSSSITTASTYTLLPIQRVDLVAAIQQAINSAGSSWAVLKDDSSSLTFTTAQVYDLPSDLVALSDVYGGDGNYWAPVMNWEIIGSPGSYKLMFKKLPELRTPALPTETPLIQMRLQYVALPTLLSTGSDTIGIGDVAERELVQYIIYYASFILHQQAFVRNVTGEAARGHMSAAESFRRQAEGIKENRQRVPVIRRVQTRSYARVVG